MARKTVKLADLVDKANARLANSKPDMARERLAIANFIESVLMDADAYGGYRYTRSEYLPADQQTGDNVLRDNYDDTRRHYSKRRIPS